MEVIEIEKAVRNHQISLALAKGQMSLVERDLSRYGHSWDRPAIGVIDGDMCVGALSLSIDDDERSVNVRLAWCDPEYPQALTVLLTRLRAWCAERKLVEVFFTAHDANGFMRKAASALNAEVHCTHYRVRL